jgi:hypothetical protein
VEGASILCASTRGRAEQGRVRARPGAVALARGHRSARRTPQVLRDGRPRRRSEVAGASGACF